jgi:hypothetical protein
MGNTLTDEEKEEIHKEIQEQRKFENQSVDKNFLKSTIAQELEPVNKKLEQLEPINNKLDSLLHKINLLTQGAISTVTGVDAINDEELQKK